MTPPFRIIAALSLLALFFVCSGAFALVVAPAKPVEGCETSKREPEVKLGPNGVYYDIPAPKCSLVRTGKAPTYHLDGGQLIPSQQTVPEGTPCLRTIKRDHFIYGQTADSGSLWALCQP